MLKKYNEAYRNQFIDVQKHYSEDEQGIISGFLKDIENFTEEDLNNFTFRYDENEKIIGVDFHYNQVGGIYEILFPSGAITFSIEELSPYLRDKIQK